MKRKPMAKRSTHPKIHYHQATRTMGFWEKVDHWFDHTNTGALVGAVLLAGGFYAFIWLMVVIESFYFTQ